SPRWCSSTTAWCRRRTSARSTRTPAGRAALAVVLSTRGIRKSFGGVEVLHGVDLDAASGSILALLGENGAGKSTLVKILAGDFTPDAGEIVVEGATHTAMN